MEKFDFYLSYYGLLLGLSVAAVANGLIDAIGARDRVKVGWLTPSLAIFIFFDITSFWLYAWGIRDSIQISWATMYLGLAIALIYYLAAGLVFPRPIEKWPVLDDYYWRNKRWIIAGILIPNLISFINTTMTRPPVLDAVYWFAQGTYWPPVIILLFTRRRWQDLTLLWVIIAGYVANAFLPSWIT